jgi:hypothetical protein
MRSAAVRSAVPYVPLWADQVQYLTEAYRGSELIREHGPVIGLSDAITQPRIQDWLVPTVASIYMSLVGPVRMAALDLNLLLATLWFGHHGHCCETTLGIGAGLSALGLLMSAATFYLGPGGPFDFRRWRQVQLIGAQATSSEVTAIVGSSRSGATAGPM